MSATAAHAYRSRIGYQAILLGGFSMLAAALLVIGNLATRDAIEQRRADDLTASLSQVIPAELHDNDLLANPITITDASGNPVTVYRALHGNAVAAVAFQVSGQGYGGPIDLILAVDPSGSILGTRVLAHSETPGLGDNIEASRSDWILGFDGRSLGNPPADRWAVKKDSGVFDQFTGATITPRAVVKAVKAGLMLFQAERDTVLAPAVIQRDGDPQTAEVR